MFFGGILGRPMKESPNMAKQTKNAIEDVKEKTLPILHRYGVDRAGLFGSVVRGEHTGESDIDLLVEMPKGATLLDLSGLEIDLAQELGRKVDVVTYRSLHPLLKERVLSEQIAII